MLTSKKVTFIVSGSIAAYKSAEVIRGLKKGGAEVHVILTAAGASFVTPLTLQTLSGNPVRTSFLDIREEGSIGHIELADRADIVVVAPASADIIAKAAQGIADDLATATLLATKAPILFAPAMNVNMWENPLTQANVNTLRRVGALFCEPSVGELACGWTGSGRLAETSAIFEAINDALTPKDLLGSSVIVTAGPTREWCDPIRFISNRSSGRMGYALARQARLRGADVTLISGPSAVSAPSGVAIERVSTAVQMHEAVMEKVLRPQGAEARTQFVFMAAAVSDHRPAETAIKKLKRDKSTGFTIEMIPNPDILLDLGQRRAEIEAASGCSLKLIGFSAETGDEEELLAYARDKLERKRVDLVVANFAEDGFEKDTNRVWLLSRTGRQEEIATADKEFIAEKIISVALKI